MKSKGELRTGFGQKERVYRQGGLGAQGAWSRESMHNQPIVSSATCLASQCLPHLSAVCELNANEIEFSKDEFCFMKLTFQHRYMFECLFIHIHVCMYVLVQCLMVK